MLNSAEAAARGVDGILHFRLPSKNRLNQTETATFEILLFRASLFSRDSFFCIKASICTYFQMQNNTCNNIFSDEQRRNQANIEKILKEQQKAQEEALQKQKKEMENHYKKIEEDRLEQEKIERKRYEELAKECLDKETAEKEVNRYRKEEKERRQKWFGARMWNAFWNN